MVAHTSMLHVRVDDELKGDAAEKLTSFTTKNAEPGG